MYERYKQLDENNDVDNSESGSEEAEYEIYSQDEDKQIFSENKKDLKKRSKRLNLTKKQIEFDGDCIILAVNSLRKFYYVFNFKWNRHVSQDCLGLGDDFDSKFIDEFSNWMDKLTEGLDLNKKIIKDWPIFS